MPLALLACVVLYTGVLGDELTPVFKSIPTTVKTREHDTVFLPCYVQNQGTNKVKWWRNDELIAVSYPRTVLVDKVALHPNNTLELTDLGDEDSGHYTCQVIREPPWGPINQTHVITVLISPTVSMEPNVGSLDVDLHAEVTLNCSASGVPEPPITWTFNGEEIQLLSQRSSLRLLASSARMSGDYACIASNGVGDPAVANIHIRVIYPPVVTVPELWVHTAPGVRSELYCNVDASPPAKVIWLKERNKVETGARIVTSRKESLHGLVILKTKSTDIGYYTCLAVNSKGSAQQVIQLAGVPDMPKFKDSYFRRDEKNISLAWQVDSYSPIIQYNLLFRQYKGGNWSRLLIPAEISSNGPLYEQTYSLSGLQPATIYETSVLARNVFGWSKPSAIFRFATIGTELQTQPEEGTESNLITDYLPGEYVTLDTWQSWENSSSRPSLSQAALLIFFLRWCYEFRSSYL